MIHGVSCSGCPYNCQECLNHRDCQQCKTGLYKLVRDGTLYCVWHCPQGYLPQVDDKEQKSCVKGNKATIHLSLTERQKRKYDDLLKLDVLLFIIVTRQLAMMVKSRSRGTAHKKVTGGDCLKNYMEPFYEFQTLIMYLNLAFWV